MDLEHRILFETIFHENENIIKEEFLNKLNIVSYTRDGSIAKSSAGTEYKFFYDSSTGAVGCMTMYDWRSDIDIKPNHVLFQCNKVNQNIFEVFKECLKNLVDKGV